MAKWTDRAREDIARSQGEQTVSTVTTKPTTQSVPQATPKATTQQPKMEQSTPSGGWTARLRADIAKSKQTGQAQRTAQRDDAGVRARYAELHPEMTGGEVGARTREVNSKWVKASVAKKKAQEEADRLQKERETTRQQWAGLSRAGNAGDLQKATKERLDTLDASLTAANEALKKAEGELGALAEARYYDRGQRAFAQLDADPAAKQSYHEADDARGDQDKLNQVLLYYSGSGLYTPEETDAILGYEEELQGKYGLKHQDFIDYISGETPQAIVNATTKMEAAFGKSRGELEADGQYNYHDMSGYTKRLEQQQARALANEANARLADAMPVLSSVGTFFAQPFRFFDVLATDWGRGDPEDVDYVPPSNGPGIGDAVDTVRGTVSEGIKKKFKDQEWLGNTLSFLYQTGMSTGDSALSVATLGPGSVYLMGTNAAVGEARGIIDRGGTAKQALWGGLAAGAAEIAFEKISVENLLEPKSITGWRSWVKETLKQGGVEASEEMCTEIANILSDTAIMGEKSDFNQAVEQYKAQGLGEEEAKRKAYLDMVGQVALAGAGGAISGGVMGGAKRGYEAVSANSQFSAQGQEFQTMGQDVVDAIIQEGLDSDPSTESYKTAKKLQDRQSAGKEIKPQDLGRLYQANVETIQAEEAAKAQKIASEGNRLLNEQDLEEYLSVGERKHVRDLKEAQARTGNSPILTTMEQIKSFIRSALSGEVRDTIKGYGKVGTRMVEDLRLEGVDVDGYYLELDANRLGHLSDHMGDDGDQRNIPLTQEQAESITSYIDSYDDVLDVVRHKDGGVRITLGKKINGHAVVVELVSKGRKSIQPVTAWQNDTEHYLRKYGQKETQAIDTSHSHEGEESGYKQLAPKTSIPQTAQNVNLERSDLARTEARVQELERDAQKTASGVETESTAIDTNPTTHTPEQQAVIAQYQARTDEMLKEVFQGYLDNPKQGFSRHNISDVSQRQAQDAQRLLGGAYEGYHNAINSNGIQHILGEHGPEGTADHSLGDLNDIARMGYVLDHYDDVQVVTYESGDVDFSSEFRDKNDRPAPMLKFSKRVDGTYYVVEAIPESKHKKFWVVSAYMEKAEGGTQAPDAQSPRTTPNASLASWPSADSSIPQTARDVNLEGSDLARTEARVQELERGIAELDQQKVNRGAQGLGTQGQATVTAMYLEGQDAGTYVQGMRELYAAGQAGVAMESVASKAAQSLNDHQRRAAYEAGWMDAAAQTTQSGQKAGFAKVAGKEKGLVWDSYVEQNVDPEVARRLNEVAKRLNVRVRFVDSVLDGWANGQIVEADIRIAKDAEQPVMVVFGHEVGHWLEKTAPEAYQAMWQYASEHHMEEIRGLMELYAQAGQAQDVEGIRKEFLNDDIGRIIADSQALLDFVEENKNNRTLLQKIADALRALWQKLTGQDRRQVKSAEEALLAALRASEAAATKLEQAGQVMDFAQATQGGEYLLKGRRADGIEVYETSDEVKAMPYKERMARFQEIMEAEYAGRTARFDTDGEAYYAIFDSKDIEKNIYGDKKSSRKGWKAKINTGADGGIFDLVEHADYSGPGEESGVKKNKAHKGVIGWDYFVKKVQIDGQVYDLVANVRKKPDGEYVYSIQLNEDKETSASPVAVFAQGDPALKVGETDTDIIPQPGEDVNGDYSLKGGAALAERTAQLEEQSRQEGWSQEQLQGEVRAAVSQILQELADEYGTIKPGENRAREVQMPRRTAKNGKVSQTVRTILEAGATPESAVPTIEELAAGGTFSYTAQTDKAAIERARKAIQHKGWGNSLSDWFQTVKSGKVSKDNTAVGWALYNHAANTGDIQTAMDILQGMVRHQRNAAQAMQATRILKQMDPETQLYGAQRSVESLQTELNERYGDGKAPKLTIDTELAERLMQARDQETRDKVLQDIYRDIGRQMPSTFADKWNAWRYLSMLGNARTHVRNIVGNAGFAPVVLVKDATATAIERAVYAVSGGKLERSKGLVDLGKKGRGLLAAAWGDYAKVQEVALGGGKYGEFQNANRYIEEGRVVFQSKPGKALEAARRANSTALDVEDMWFSKPHYAYAMAQYCAANGITEETIRSGDAAALGKAREYAIREAQKATYRDTNVLSQTLSGLGGNLRRSKNGVSRAMGLMVEGVLPFRKTPANILARGLEYSPMGLVKGLSYDLGKLYRGKISGAEVIDHVSAGLTGTGLLALGVYLAAQGLLRGKGAGDDKERAMQKLQGHQDYSLEIGDVSITLDWLAPEALPLFVGANLWETMQEDGEITMSGMLNAASHVSDPLLEMSCLQSLNDIFDSVGYAGQNETSPLVSILVSGTTSYLTQGLPTVFGQGERVFETQRETTYTNKDAFLTGDMQYFLGKVSGKVPGWEFQQIPYIDAWGRTESSGDLGQRAFNMLNPAYVSEIESGQVEEELERLYNATGEGGVFPTRARKYFQVNGKRHDLSADEYVDYATRKGQTARKVVEALVKQKEYSGLEEGEKAEAVKDAYQYAEQTARQGVAKEYAPDSWVAKAQKGEKEYKVSVATYIMLRQRTAGLGSLKDKSGESIANSKGLQIMEAVYDTPGLGDRQRGYLFEALGVGKSIQHYNKAKVKEDLGKLRKQTK